MKLQIKFQMKRRKEKTIIEEENKNKNVLIQTFVYQTNIDFYSFQNKKTKN